MKLLKHVWSNKLTINDIILFYYKRIQTDTYNSLKLPVQVERRRRVEVPLREVMRGTVTSEGVKKDKQTTFPYLWHQLILSGTVCCGRASALSG